MAVTRILLLALTLAGCQGDAAEQGAAPGPAAEPATEPVMTAAPDTGDVVDEADPATADEPAAPSSGPDSGPAPSTDAPDRASETPPPATNPSTAPSTDEPTISAGPPAEGASEQDPTVQEVLRATSRRYEGIRSLSADFVQELENTLLGRTVRSRGELFQRQPDRFLMRFSDPAGDVIVSDGANFWIYLPSSDPKQVIRSRRGAQGLDLRTQFVGDPVERFRATYHGRETVDGRSTHVITLDPRQPLGYRRLKVWIDARDHLVRRFDLTEDNGIVRKFRLTDLETNPSLPDSLFEFTPPPGTHVVDGG